MSKSLPLNSKLRKFNLRLFILMAFMLLVASQQKAQAQTGSIGIGTTTPNASSILHIESQTKGVLLPRMTEIERDAIQANNIPLPGNTAINGLIIYNTTTGRLNVWRINAWYDVSNGPKGDQGDTGATGSTGPAGVDGATILSGIIDPIAADGKNGDYYLNTASNDLFTKSAGVWTVSTNLRGASGTNGTNGKNGTNGTNGSNGSNGTNGTDGTDGATILSGVVNPVPSDGKNGDLYLNTASNTVFIKDNTGVWNAQTVIKGDKGDKGDSGNQGTAGSTGSTGATGLPGTAGSKIFSAAGAPAALTGVDTDFYHNVTNGDVYQKSGGVWNLTGNIKGPMGTVWLQNSGAPAANIGKVKDFYLDLLTGNVWEKGASGWVFSGGSIKGEGAQNTWLLNGNAGITGSMAFNWFGTRDAQDIVIGTDGEERMRIMGTNVNNNKGFVGISQLSPRAQLDVNGTFRLGSGTPLSSVLNNIIKLTVNKSVPSIPASSSTKVTYDITGVTTVGSVFVSPAAAMPDGIVIAYARVKADDQVEIMFTNVTGAPIPIPTMDYHITIIQ